jgi:hypothetical protein
VGIIKITLFCHFLGVSVGANKGGVCQTKKKEVLMRSNTTIGKLNEIKGKAANEPVNYKNLSEEQIERIANRSRYCMLLGIIMMLEPALDELLPLSKGDPGGALFEKNMKSMEEAVRIPESAMLYVLHVLRDVNKEDFIKALDDTFSVVRKALLSSYSIEGAGDGS